MCVRACGEEEPNKIIFSSFTCFLLLSIAQKGSIAYGGKVHLCVHVLRTGCAVSFVII